MLADRSAAEPILREAARRAARLGQPVLASWTRPTTTRDPIGFFAQAAHRVDRALWLRPETGEALVGVGAARVLTGRGRARFAQVSAAWRDLLADAVVGDDAASPQGGPVLVGGFSFDPLRAPGGAWQSFTDSADARLVLFERQLLVRRGAAWLTTNVVVLPGNAPPAAAQCAPLTLHARPDGDSEPLSPGAWQALVGSTVKGIRQGQLGIDKVVLARSVAVHHSHAIDPIHAVRQLAAGHPSCTVFAVGHRDACFLGATPERLIALHHGAASTMALAGSFPRGASPAQDRALADQLRQDPKERAEHAIVVGALRDGLAEVCTRIVADAQPRVQKLPNLQHLVTPIRGQVGPGRGVLDLVERLHPTPAMGGFPRQRALEFIRTSEGLDRGWYAAPVGWVNRAGEGEFVVGIRSALVQGAAATLFAGCGIMAASNPATEYAESGWKLRPMLAALGLEPQPNP
ncbi:MAG: isochorismate synthase [Chloroflexi bacterium]|nr:isochorismate synthase [Chloroflexota bacterium]